MSAILAPLKEMLKLGQVRLTDWKGETHKYHILLGLWRADNQERKKLPCVKDMNSGNNKNANKCICPKCLVIGEQMADDGIELVNRDAQEHKQALMTQDPELLAKYNLQNSVEVF